MKKRMLIMVGIVVVILAVLGFIKFQQIRAAIAQGSSFQPPPEAVTTVVASMQEWPATIEAVGGVAAVQGVVLSADLAGVVDEILFTSGVRVDSGQVLVRLDTRQERAQLASAEAQRDLAKTEYDRAVKLREQNVIAEAGFDEAQARFKQAQATVAEIRAAIDRKTITAPFAGRTGIREVNLGQYVHSGDPVVPLQSEVPIYVNFSVPQQEINRLHVGAVVNAVSDSGVVATGRLTAINPVVDQNTRNVQVQATFRNQDRSLRPGAYASVEVETGARTPLIGLPTSAINYAPYGNSVFIVDSLTSDKNGKYLGVRQQFVKLGASRGDRVAVLSGVQAGDEVVTSGVFKLRPSAAVAVNNEVQPSNSLDPKTRDD